ncbi:MAG: XRE family transcriptional regulator [Elusimicrobiales bacterium]|jgi:Zn-dependent peptidase ImmA (M78 family)/transcriptional regulator with XRE-family HTH domain
MNIATRLKAVRAAFGLTLSDVSKQTDIGISSLSDFENGKREPMLGQLKKLSGLYQKPVSFFLETAAIKDPCILWRNKPSAPKSVQLEAEFVKFCTQYQNLEVWTKSAKVNSFKNLFAAVFPNDYAEVKQLAHVICKGMELGARPGASLFRVLEEVYGVKIFHISLGGDASSACIYTEEYGPAIMLNSDSAQWRRNFDLAHELFHLVTWNVRTKTELMEKEEKFANHFAGVLLMPEQEIREIIDLSLKNDSLLYNDLDTIARQFDVSLDALLWRIHQLYNTPQEATIKWIEETKLYSQLPLRRSEKPEKLPSRYKSLAFAALKEGEISTRQFANYMDMNISDTYSYQIGDGANAFKINDSPM